MSRGAAARDLLLVLIVLGGVRGAQWAQAPAGAAGLDAEQAAAREVDVPVLERGEPVDGSRGVPVVPVRRKARREYENRVGTLTP
ncbi:MULTISPECIES: hypothetical protein [Streptomyces]|uniref:hypothetical protein n=1 Tax=Streptomyces TaxID=1883 RepID=UPI0022AAF7EB|nr:hypothetical protein [Streptomyces sp. HB2AG]MCZ2528237.1 hypothetical protein [Streptomyces sp. HB2AG]